MGLFGGTKRARTIAFIDIASGSVAGGIARVDDTKLPLLLFSTRLKTEERAEGELGILRALDSLAEATTAATPQIRAAMGEATVSEAYVSIGAPWQSTSVETRREAGTSILINESYLHTLLEGKEEDATTHTELISATLNGYIVKNPLGKRVQEAEFTVLHASMKPELHNRIVRSLRRMAPKATFVPHARLIANGLKRLFPHQQEYLALLVSEESTEIVMTKNGVLRTLAHSARGTNAFTRVGKSAGIVSATHTPLIDAARNEQLAAALQVAEDAWLTELTEQLTAIAAGHALPPTVFLIAERTTRDFLKRLVSSEHIAALWLGGAKATIAPVLPEHLTPFVTLAEGAAPDEALELLVASYRA